MSNPSIEYIAGFFDGEGHCSICINPIMRHNKTYITFKLDVGVTNNDYFIIKSTQSFFNNIGLIYSIKPSSDRRKENYRWKVWKQSDVKIVLEKLFPYLIVKKRKAKLILQFINSRLSHPHQKSTTKIPYTKYEIEIVKKLKKENERLRGNGNKKWKRQQ